MKAHLLSTAYSIPKIKSKSTVFDLSKEALESALHKSALLLSQLDALITVPSLAEPKFMEAHSLATKLSVFPHPRFVAKTIDVGGAGPVSCLIEAKRLITEKRHHLVAVVAADTITSMPSELFIRRADAGFIDSGSGGHLESPFIPNAYNLIAEWHIKQGYVTREQLAMCTVLMSQQAARHPDAITKKPYTLSDVLNAKHVAPVTSLYECARRVDGAAAILVASSELIFEIASRRRKEGLQRLIYPTILGGGETSGPLYPPPLDNISDDLFTSGEAFDQALSEASVDATDIDFYGLYDCFPICLIKALESAQLAPKFGGGAYVEQVYKDSVSQPDLLVNPNNFPVNTHGGLLCFGAPWETPAMYNIIEAVEQLRGTAKGREIRDANTAIVYGNGGIFSASSVAVLKNEEC